MPSSKANEDVAALQSKLKVRKKSMNPEELTRYHNWRSRLLLTTTTDTSRLSYCNLMGSCISENSGYMIE